VAPFGLGVVFFNVLLEQLGLPLPAVPTLVVAGALAADGKLSAAGVCAFALTACLIGECIWYLAGRLYGVGTLRLLCRISLTPDICVSQTQMSFERWGAKALLFAKFVPGLSMIAPPLAGATHMSFRRFLGFSALGDASWVVAAVLGGVLLRPAIVPLLPKLVGVGGAALVLIVGLLAAYIAFKWWERRRFFAALDMQRISVGDLHAQLSGAAAPIVVDVRSPTTQAVDLRRIPGALHVPLHAVDAHLGSLPRDREIIFYCNCPNEASAAQAARVLLNHGFRHVRPLRGGLDAWIAAGYAVEGIEGELSSAAAEPSPAETPSGARAPASIR
jgi:membrane protein DedA with SNARE-associated domain/rhodanese-related sulfurtransferase